MDAHLPYEVVDHRLAAGRGEEFSASALREKEQQAWFNDDTWHMPLGTRIEENLDTDGLQMASTDVAISQENKGFQMLQRMGWGGKGLGRNEDGILEPVRGGVEAGLRLGLGKAEQDSFYTAADNVQRKKLEVELQAEEDEERTKRREMHVEREQRIKTDVAEAKRNLYCQVCHKQYSTALEMETHLSSYDHHHKKRLKEMKDMTADRTRRERERKERKRAEKEMARMNEQFARAQRSSGTGPPIEQPTDPQPPQPTAAPHPPPPPAFGGPSQAQPPLPPDYSTPTWPTPPAQHQTPGGFAPPPPPPPPLEPMEGVVGFGQPTPPPLSPGNGPPPPPPLPPAAEAGPPPLPPAPVRFNFGGAAPNQVAANGGSGMKIGFGMTNKRLKAAPLKPAVAAFKLDSDED